MTPWRWRLIKIALYAALLLGLFLFVTYRPPIHFTQCTTDPRIRCEPGSEVFAKQLAQHLDDAVATVKREQYGAFTRPVVVQLYATHASFGESLGLAANRTGVVDDGVAHMSPQALLSNAGEFGPLMAHQMSHLQLNLDLGDWAYDALPLWFREGLAFHVAHQSGMDIANEETALLAMAERTCFVPTADKSRFSESAEFYGPLSGPVFRRQSAMFVSWLRARDAEAFRRMLAAVGRKDTAGVAIESEYGLSLQALWREFLEQARKDFNSRSTTQAERLCYA